MARRMAFSVSTRSSIVNSPIASKSPGIHKAPCRTDWSSTGKPDAKDRNLDAASSSQGWQKDAFLDLCTEKLVATEEDQEHLNCPEDSVSTGKPLSQNIQDIQETQETQEPKAMTKIGHTISILQQTTCCTWRRSSRSWDKDTVAVQRIKWKTTMWTQRSRVHSCLSLFKLQFILGNITRKICDRPRTNPWNLWDSYFKWVRGWSRIRQKVLDWPRLTVSSLCGERRLC